VSCQKTLQARDGFVNDQPIRQALATCFQLIARNHKVLEPSLCIREFYGLHCKPRQGVLCSIAHVQILIVQERIQSRNTTIWQNTGATNRLRGM